MSDTNTSSSAPVKKNITRRDVLAMAGCGVAGLVVGGVLASWGVTRIPSHPAASSCAPRPPR